MLILKVVLHCTMTFHSLNDFFMKMYLVLTVIILALPLFTYSQKKTEPKETTVLPTDIYSNFEQRPRAGKSYLVLKSETGKIIFEDTIENGQCISCYERLTEKADSFYSKMKLNEAAILYTSAFKLNNDKGKIKHRYKAACSWTILNNKENAFAELKRIVFVGKYSNYYQINSDDCFKPLHNDSRWKEIVEGVKKNLKEAEEKLNKEMIIEQ